METKKLSKGPKAAILVVAILTGVLFCCLGIKMFNILFTIIGAILVLGGVLALVSKRFIAGILLVVIGGLIIASAWIPNWINVAYIIFGVMMLLSGIFGFVISVHNEDAGSCVSSALSAVLGGFFDRI